MPINEGLVGNQAGGAADGDVCIARMGKDSSLIVGEAHGQFFESSSRNISAYAASSAGVAPGTTVAATTASIWLHNPIGSDVFLAVTSCRIGYISGTLGAGTLFWTTVTGRQQANPTAGTDLTPRSARVTASFTPKGQVRSGTTVAANMVPLRPICSMGAILATSAVRPYVVHDYLAGEIVVAPGYGVGMRAQAAAGTSPLLSYGIRWIEVPITAETEASRGK